LYSYHGREIKLPEVTVCSIDWRRGGIEGGKFSGETQQEGLHNLKKKDHIRYLRSMSGVENRRKKRCRKKGFSWEGVFW